MPFGIVFHGGSDFDGPRPWKSIFYMVSDRFQFRFQISFFFSETATNFEKTKKTKNEKKNVGVNWGGGPPGRSFRCCFDFGYKTVYVGILGWGTTRQVLPVLF